MGSFRPRVEAFIESLNLYGFRVRDTNDPDTGVLIEDTDNPAREPTFIHARDLIPEKDGQLKPSVRNSIAGFVQRP